MDRTIRPGESDARSAGKPVTWISGRPTRGMQGSGIAHSRLGGGAGLGGALVTNASLATLGLGTLRSRRGKGCRGQHRGQVCFLTTRYGKPRRRGNRDASARAADGATETRSKRNEHHPNEMISASPRGSDARDASIAALIARPPVAKNRRGIRVCCE